MKAPNGIINPEAAQVVIHSHVKTVLVPLNLTNQYSVTGGFYKRLNTSLIPP